MDFDYSPQEESFRQELRSWLKTNLPEEYDPETFETLDEDARFKIRLKWQKKLHAVGLVGVHWPKEYGGRGATVVEQAIYQQEMARVRAPGVANPLGISIVGPTLMHWGLKNRRNAMCRKSSARKKFGVRDIPNQAQGLISPRYRPGRLKTVITL